MSPTRRTSLSTLATPTEVTSLGEFQPHFGSHGQEDQKQRNNEGQRIRNNNDLLYKPFPPTSTGLIFKFHYFCTVFEAFKKCLILHTFWASEASYFGSRFFHGNFFFCLREKKKFPNYFPKFFPIFFPKNFSQFFPPVFNFSNKIFFSNFSKNVHQRSFFTRNIVKWDFSVFN